jgi:hypothetical protein
MSSGCYPPGVTGNEPELNGPENLCPKCETELDDEWNCPNCGYSTPRCPRCDSPTGRLVNGRMTCCRETARGIRYLLFED